MSAELWVNQNSEHVRDTSDYYPTDPRAVRAAYNELARLAPDFAPARVLDPGAGDGPWGEEAQRIWRRPYIVGVELRPEVPAHPAYDEWFRGSFISLPTPKEPKGPWKTEKAEERARAQYAFDLWAGEQPVWSPRPASEVDARWLGYEIFDLVVGNPPYGKARQFVEDAMAVLRPGGWLMFLLRLGFLAGQARAKELYRQYPLRHCAVLAQRPSFSGDGKTDAEEYGIFFFQKGFVGQWTGSQLLYDDPPPIKRQASVFRTQTTPKVPVLAQLSLF